MLAVAEGSGHTSTTDPHTVSGLITLFTILLAVSVAVAVVTKRIRVPYTVALVIAGLTVAAFQAAPVGAALNPELVFYIVLPPILFRAGLLIDINALGKNWLSIAIVTTLGTIVTTLVVGVAIHPFLTPDIVPEQFSWLASFLLGAMLSPTDPIAVMAVLKRIGLPPRLRTVIEGESLFNDGIAVVLFFLLYGALYTGAVTEDATGLVPVQAQMTHVAPEDQGGSSFFIGRIRLGIPNGSSAVGWSFGRRIEVRRVHRVWIARRSISWVDSALDDAVGPGPGS